MKASTLGFPAPKTAVTEGTGGEGALLPSGPVGNVDAKSQRVVPGPSLSHRRHWPVPPGSHITNVSVGARMPQGVPAGGSRVVGAAPCLRALGSSPTTLGRRCCLHTQHPSPLLHQLDLGSNEFYRKTFFVRCHGGTQAAECEYC